MEECETFISMKREYRHRKTLEHQRLKLESLCQKNNTCKGCSLHIDHRGHHSNIHHGNHTLTSNQTASDSNSNTNTLIRNNSSKPLTEAQEELLAHRPNFAVVPRYPFIGEYIAAVEQACQQLKQREAE